MSSPFSGLDPREYAYSVFDLTVGGSAVNIRCEQVWLVHRIQAYASTTVAGTIQLASTGSGSVPVAAGGCLLLEPNGLYRQNIVCLGSGMLVIVEYFYQATPSGFPPTIIIT